MMISYPLSPEFFLYIYVLNPLLTSDTSPWAWKMHPSTFDTIENKIKCDNILIKRRLSAIINFLNILKVDLIEELNEEKINSKQIQLQIIHQILQKDTFDKALQELNSLYYLKSKKKSSSNNNNELKLENVNGQLIKQICNGFGIDGYPNLPLIRRFNIGELSKYIQKV